MIRAGLGLVGIAVAMLAGRLAAQPVAVAEPPAVLPVQTAVLYALENNPVLAAQRQQRGIAAARIVIADTYPFNPVFENRFQAAAGPTSANVTYKAPMENLVLWETEIRKQRRYRRQVAAAALTRTELEIAFQEQTLAVDVMRAYTLLVYRQQKVAILDEMLRLNQQLVADVRQLTAIGRLRAVDLIVAQTELADTLDLMVAARELAVAARQDLNRTLGVIDSGFATDGLLDVPPWQWQDDAPCLSELALTRRFDLRARQLAVAEAAANVRLTVANSKGNPILGAAYAIDPSRVSAIGVQINMPIPIANRHRGEIHQSEAEQMLASHQLRQSEFAVKQEVAAAFARLAAADQRVEQSRSRSIPGLEAAVRDLEKLFQAGEPGIDVLKVIDVRRKLLRARDSYLDALWSYRLAIIDVAAATGEPLIQDQPKP